MNWIAYSLLMFFSSIALYLCIRKAFLAKIPVSLTNLAMFVVPLLIYIILGIDSSAKLSVSVFQLIVLIFAGVIFAYGGNTFSLKAIDIAPNPGYSLVLSKSYVLFTTIFAVVVLHANLTIWKALAILIIIFFSIVIIINKKEAKNVRDNQWVLLSFGAFFCWGLLSLSSKYLFSHTVSTYAFLIYIFAIVTVCTVIANRMNIRMFQKISVENWLILLGVGIFSTLFNLGQFDAIRLAPNVGYVNAINASSISLVTLLAGVFFKDSLTPKKLVGIIGVTAGLLLLLL